MANLGALAGGMAAGIESGQRMRLQRERDTRDAERHQFTMGELQRTAETRDRQEAAWEELNAAIARRMQKQVPTQMQAPQQLATTSTGEPVDQGNGVQTMALQDQGAGIPTRALPEAPVQPASPEGGLTRAPTPAAAPAQAAGQGDDPGKKIGFSLYQNPNLLRDPDFLNEAAGIFMKARMPEGVKWLERSFKAQQENGIDAMKAFIAGDAQRGLEAFNSSGRDRITNAQPIIDGEHKGKWALTFQGAQQPVMIDPGAVLRSFLDPKAYFDSLAKDQEGKRKDAESGALVAERSASARYSDARARYYDGARTNQANAAAGRAARPPESKESVDRAHQFVDSQIQRLSAVTDAKGVQVIDPDTRKPSVDQTKQNRFYQLYNDIQLDVESRLGRELSSREIRFLGQRMATAPLDDDTKRSAWAQQTISLLAGRPTGSAGKQPAQPAGKQGASSGAPADGTRVRGPDGKIYSVKGGVPVLEEGGAQSQAAPQQQGGAGLMRRPQQQGDDILGKISIQDQSAAAEVEAKSPTLRKLGDALRMTANSRAPGMQSQAAQVYQQYVEELRAAMGLPPTSEPISMAGLRRNGG